MLQQVGGADCPTMPSRGEIQELAGRIQDWVPTHPADVRMLRAWWSPAFDHPQTYRLNVTAAKLAGDRAGARDAPEG